MHRGAPGGGAASFGSDAGSSEAVVADAVEENLRDGQEPRPGASRQRWIQQRRGQRRHRGESRCWWSIGYISSSSFLIVYHRLSAGHPSAARGTINYARLLHCVCVCVCISTHVLLYTPAQKSSDKYTFVYNTNGTMNINYKLCVQCKIYQVSICICYI